MMGGRLRFMQMHPCLILCEETIITGNIYDNPELLEVWNA